MSRTQWIFGLAALVVVGAVGVLVGVLISSSANGPNLDTAQEPATKVAPSPEKKEETKKAGAKLAAGEREPLVLTGTGESATQTFTLDAPDTYQVEADYQGTSETGEWIFHTFIVRVVNTETPENAPKPNPGLKAGYIFSEFLNTDRANSGFQGSKSVRFEEPGPYVFEVDARGPWQLTIR